MFSLYGLEALRWTGQDSILSEAKGGFTEVPKPICLCKRTALKAERIFFAFNCKDRQQI